jgi:maleylpyruvate isomerase
MRFSTERLGRMAVRLHGYFRSSASWRVRIALNLKKIACEHRFYHLRRGEQRNPDYLRLNPQGLVPTLELENGAVLTQSVAIIEFLDEMHPEPPLLPLQPLERARVRAFAMALASDTHPVQNLRVLARLRDLGLREEDVQAWASDANVSGLEACEMLVGDGPFCFGAQPSLADICLVPQLGNARRFGVDIQRFPRLLAAEASCNALSAFADAVPGRQEDAE